MNRIGGVTILRKGNSDLVSDGDTGSSFTNISLIFFFILEEGDQRFYLNNNILRWQQKSLSF